MKLDLLQRLLLKKLRRICIDEVSVGGFADARSTEQILYSVIMDLVVLGILPRQLQEYISSYGVVSTLRDKVLIGLE